MSGGRLSRLAQLLALAVVAHNFEEWLGRERLPQIDADLATRVGLSIPHPSVPAFEVALIIATVIPAAVLLSSARGPIIRGKTLRIVFVAGLFLANVFVPHLAASVAAGGYTPGVATAVLVNLPLGMATIAESRRAGVGRVALFLTLVAASVALPLAVAGAYALAAAFA